MTAPLPIPALTTSTADVLPLLPMLVLAGSAFVLLLLDLFLDERRRVITHVLGIVALLAACAMLLGGVGLSLIHI